MTNGDESQLGQLSRARPWLTSLIGPHKLVGAAKYEVTGKLRPEGTFDLEMPNEQAAAAAISRLLGETVPLDELFADADGLRGWIVDVEAYSTPKSERRHDSEPWRLTGWSKRVFLSCRWIPPATVTEIKTGGRT